MKKRSFITLLIVFGMLFNMRSFADVTLSSVPVAASNIAQGSGENIVYVVKMDVTTSAVTVTSIQFTLTGTHDINALSNISVLFNISGPTVPGASVCAFTSAVFAAPHTYTINLLQNGKIISAGSSVYFIITVSTNNAATNGSTVKIDGSVNPVNFGFTLAPVIINNQSDVAGMQTILAADITLTTIPVPASDILQGTASNTVYIIKMEVNTIWSNPYIINFLLSGTYDNDDLNTVHLFINYSVPTLAGATHLQGNYAYYAAPHYYTMSFGGISIIPAGTTVYFILTVTTASSATIGNTVKIDGSANPVTFTTNGTPNLTNNQSNVAGAQTIIESPLPLTLINFTGNLLNRENVQLQWVTAAEINTKEFEVEWSKDGLNFTKIAVVTAAGNSSQNSYYKYIHTQPADGNNYYRLKMTDIDGRFTYSPVVNVKITNNSKAITAYPNPVINVVQLQFQADRDENILFNLHSADGSILESRSFNVMKGTNRLNWNMQQLASGYYFISYANKQFETIKIIKQ